MVTKTPVTKIIELVDTCVTKKDINYFEQGVDAIFSNKDYTEFEQKLVNNKIKDKKSKL